MNTTAIISEYNPLHLGHKYQINTLKNKMDTNIISIMSGDFVQRGECSILDKYKRAKIAVENGVNLVIELPFYYSLQSAENFAKGGISILNEINIVDYLCFGYESNTEDELVDIANFQVENSEILNKYINDNMKNGYSYAVAYKNACMKLSKEKNNLNIDENFFISNNILAIEYIKNLKYSQSKIKIFPIKREGQNYNSENYDCDIQLSATSIRNAIYDGEDSVIKNFVDEISFVEIKKLMEKKNFQDNNKLIDILKFCILSNTIDENKIVNYENGILNLIKNNIFNFSNFDDFIENIQSKRYKKVRIKRFIMNYLLNVTEEIKLLYSNKPTYIKVLAFDDNGLKLLKKIKSNSEIKIITKNKDSNMLDSSELKRFKLEQNARKIYKLLTNNKTDEEFIEYYIRRY